MRVETWSGGELSASYGYLAYQGPTWSNAHLIAGGLSQRFGRVRLAAGLAYELESDAQSTKYPTLFGTGSLGASF